MRPADRVARLIALISWMALITYWSGQGTLPIDQPNVANVFHGLQHRIAHVIAFGLLGLLARWAFNGLPRASLLAVLLVSAFGATDEWHQSFTPGRRAALDDWAVDTAAAALALYAWTRFRPTQWHARIRQFAPVAIAAVFVLGVGLAVRPSLNRPADLNTNTLRSAAHTALDFARSTREVARQLRSTVTG
jgi:VanZ family protein